MTEEVKNKGGAPKGPRRGKLYIVTMDGSEEQHVIMAKTRWDAMRYAINGMMHVRPVRERDVPFVLEYQKENEIHDAMNVKKEKTNG